MTDFTRVPPKTELERKTLNEALQLTRDAYFKISATQAPYTDPHLSYEDQWQQISTSFDIAWSLETFVFDQAPPALPKLSAQNWGKSLTEWEYDGQRGSKTASENDGLDPVESAPVIDFDEHVATNEEDRDILEQGVGGDYAQEDCGRAKDVEGFQADERQAEVDNQDCREIAPANEADGDAIERTLKLTRGAFLRITRMEAPRTTWDASYADQYREILAVLEALWNAEESLSDECEAMPVLAHWTAKQYSAYIQATRDEAAEEAAAMGAEEEEEL